MFRNFLLTILIIWYIKGKKWGSDHKGKLKILLGPILWIIIWYIKGKKWGSDHKGKLKIIYIKLLKLSVKSFETLTIYSFIANLATKACYQWRYFMSEWFDIYKIIINSNYEL